MQTRYLLHTCARNRRHDRIVQIIAQILREAQRAPTIEPRVIHQHFHTGPAPDNTTVDADSDADGDTTHTHTYTPNLPPAPTSAPQAQQAALISLTSPLRTACITQINTQVRHSHCSPNGTRTNCRHAAYARSMRNEGAVVRPVIVCATGGHHPESHTHLRDAIASACASSCAPLQAATSLTFQQLPQTLVTYNVRCWLDGRNSLNPSPHPHGSLARHPDTTQTD